MGLIAVLGALRDKRGQRKRIFFSPRVSRVLQWALYRLANFILWSQLLTFHEIRCSLQRGRRVKAEKENRDLVQKLCISFHERRQPSFPVDFEQRILSTSSNAIFVMLLFKQDTLSKRLQLRSQRYFIYKVFKIINPKNLSRSAGNTPVRGSMSASWHRPIYKNNTRNKFKKTLRKSFHLLSDYAM